MVVQRHTLRVACSDHSAMALAESKVQVPLYVVAGYDMVETTKDDTVKRFAPIFRSNTPCGTLEVSSPC